MEWCGLLGLRLIRSAAGACRTCSRTTRGFCSWASIPACAPWQCRRISAAGATASIPLYRAGILDRRIDASAGFRPEDLAHLLERGLGITSLVAGASARADELTPKQLIAGAAALSERVERIAPAVVAVLGITAYRTAFARPQATVGHQAEPLGGRDRTLHRIGMTCRDCRI